MRALLLALTLCGAAHGARPAKPSKGAATARGASGLRRQAEAALAQDRDAEAAALLQKVVTATPSDGAAWLMLARALSAASGGSEPQEPCDERKAWPYRALSALNEARGLKINVADALAATDPKLSTLKRRPEFRKWEASRVKAPRGDAALTEFIRQNGSWVRPRGETVFMDLEPGGTLQRYLPTDGDRGAAEGTWRVKKERVELVLEEGGTQRVELTVGPYAWQLRGPDGIWEPAPLLHDCEEADKPKRR